MKKKLVSLCLLLCVMFSASTVFAADTEYIPLRETFENMGWTVSWFAETPEKVFVNIGAYQLVFQDGSSRVIVDEGEFDIGKKAYVEDGVTNILEDTVELCERLFLYHKAIIDGDVWVFTEEEIYAWGQQNGMAEDMELRMEQLIGLPPQDGKTHFSVLRVDPADLYRPSRDNEIDDALSQLTFPENVTEEYKAWFTENAEYSYNPHRYPWTGLGYTYDWADNGTEYGLSEFILKNGAEVTVEKTYTNEEFFKYITTLK